jgi:DNA-binding CsgD family transcriptional regulator
MRIEDSDVLVDLYRGAGEVPPWRGFLNRLEDRAKALLLILPEGAISQGFQVIGGTDLPFTADALLRLRYQRVYAAEELSGPRMFQFARILRVRVDAWLIVGRDGAEFPAAFTLMMSGLGPHLAVAVASYLEQSQMRETATLVDRLSAKFQTGVLTLNMAGVILNASAFALQLLANTETVYGQIGTKLGLPMPAAKTLSDRLADYENGTNQDALAVQIENLQMLIQPYQTGQNPAALVHLRTITPSTVTGAATLAQLVHITPSEARFALKLAEGFTIAEAGVALGLTLETARNYSKQIYFKMDLRGQSDLIRYLQNSVIPLI